MEPFKNEFTYQKVQQVAKCLANVYPKFSCEKFNEQLEAALIPLEMKQRMRLIADRIEAGLPHHPPEMFHILLKLLPTGEDETNGLRGFLVWPLTEIVARRGLMHFKEAMTALREMTPYFTCEFAIRPFLHREPAQTLAQLHDWCDHPNPHVRRLVSEGSRPLLPWGERLNEMLAAPFPTLCLLEKLYRDPCASVRLSVSNHLNDLSKHHPSKVLETLKRWKKAHPKDPTVDKVARHACRTLLKDGHPGALRFHGFASTDALKMEVFELSEKSIRLGESIHYRAVIHNNSSRVLKVMFDYAILHRKANDTLSPKVFKGRIRTLIAGARCEILGSHSLKPVTTRVYHLGRQGIEPRLNGRAFPAVSFTLK